MSNVRIPDPVTRQFQDRDGKWCGFIDQRHYENTLADGSWPIRDLFDTERAEAYAQALAVEKVREALEEAAQACEARIGQHSPGMTPEDVEDCDEEARLCASAVRALIPQQT